MKKTTEFAGDQAMNRKKQRKPLEHWHIIALCLAVYDCFVVNVSYFAALWLRFDCRFTMIPAAFRDAWLQLVPFYGVLCLVIFLLFKLYQSIWRFASFNEFIRITAASLVTSVVHSVIIGVFVRKMPVSYHIVGAVLQFATVVGIRFAYRVVILIRNNRTKLRELGVRND